jgi:hypothetical protein
MSSSIVFNNKDLTNIVISFLNYKDIISFLILYKDNRLNNYKSQILQNKITKIFYYYKNLKQNRLLRLKLSYNPFLFRFKFLLYNIIIDKYNSLSFINKQRYLSNIKNKKIHRLIKDRVIDDTNINIFKNITQKNFRILLKSLDINTLLYIK